MQGLQARLTHVEAEAAQRTASALEAPALRRGGQGLAGRIARGGFDEARPIEPLPLRKRTVVLIFYALDTQASLQRLDDLPASIRDNLKSRDAIYRSRSTQMSSTSN